MDFTLFFVIFAIILAIPAIRNIRASYRFNEELKEQTKAQKLRYHLIQNIIDDKECYCTPECLRQTKNQRLDKTLRPISISHSSGLFVPLSRVSTSMQFVSESSFGAP